jgi:shikimate 5-dehydrogenase
MLQRPSGSTAEQAHQYHCHQLEHRLGREHAERVGAPALTTKKYYITQEFRGLALTHPVKRLILERIQLRE